MSDNIKKYYYVNRINFFLPVKNGKNPFSLKLLNFHINLSAAWKLAHMW